MRYETYSVPASPRRRAITPMFLGLALASCCIGATAGYAWVRLPVEDIASEHARTILEKDTDHLHRKAAIVAIYRDMEKNITELRRITDGKSSEAVDAAVALENTRRMLAR